MKKKYSTKKLRGKAVKIVSLGIIALLCAAYAEFGGDIGFPNESEHGEFEEIVIDDGSSVTSEENSSLDVIDAATGGRLTKDNAINEIYGPYKVERVVDGDTFVMQVDGVSYKVRMIGVDTPESVARGSRAEDNCEEGKIASDYLKDLIEGKRVYIEYDVAPEDRYGRILAYAYLEDGRQIEEILLSKGYARVMTISPNVAYASIYSSIQENARNRNAGFWQSDPWS